MGRTTTIAACAVGPLACDAQARTGICRRSDEDGKVHFGDTRRREGAASAAPPSSV
jgi:hypothetical protein